VKKIVILGVILFLVAGVGWGKNIIKLSNCDFQPPYRAEVIHTMGLIPLIGAVTGWLDLGE
jgi:hypothetical protein